MRSIVNLRYFTRRTWKKRFCQKIKKNLDTDLKIILLNYQNNYVRRWLQEY